MPMTTPFPIHAGNRYTKRLLGTLLVILVVPISVVAQEISIRPNELACPVTADLSTEQERSGNSIKYVFPDGSILRRISMALVHPEAQDIHVRYKWVAAKDSRLWGERTGVLVANGKGKTDCFFLGWRADLPENVPCQEFVLVIPEDILVKEISFSSLPSEKPQVLCPMPELERQIKQAFADCSQSPQDKNKALLLIQLLDKATPTYDCRRSYDTMPVPAWWLAVDEDPWRWVDYLHDRILEDNDDALRVFQKFLASSDGAFAEVWSEEMWEILTNKPLLVVENWTGIENNKDWVLVARPWPAGEGYSRINQVIEIYRDIAVKEPKYKSACDEIISILGKKSQAEY